MWSHTHRVQGIACRQHTGLSDKSLPETLKVVRLLEPNYSAPGAEWRRTTAIWLQAPNGAERLRRTILAPNWRRTLAPNGAGAELFFP